MGHAAIEGCYNNKSLQSCLKSEKRTYVPPNLSSIHDDGIEVFRLLLWFLGLQKRKDCGSLAIRPSHAKLYRIFFGPTKVLVPTPTFQHDRNCKLTMLGFLSEDCSSWWRAMSLMEELARHRRLWPRGGLRRRRVRRWRRSVAPFRSRAWTAPIPSK